MKLPDSRPDVTRKELCLEDFIDPSWHRKRVLNIGSGNVRLPGNVTNLDIQPGKDVDILADAHTLPLRDRCFDIVVLIATLQYCREPHTVAKECARVLDASGTIYVDAPFLQPYCEDTPDLFRFTQDGLRVIFEPYFHLERCEISIAAPSALAVFLQRQFAKTGSRLCDGVIQLAMSVFGYPLKFTPPRLMRDSHAGAFFLVGRKRT